VISQTQTRLGKACSNRLLSTLADTAMLCKLSVVWTHLRRQTGRKPLSRIKVRTLWRPMAWPRSAINVVSLRLPYALWLAAKAAFK